MKTMNNSKSVDAGSGYREIPPVSNGFVLRNRVLPLAGALACLAAVPVMAAPVPLVNPAGTGLCATATIDGDAAEWNRDAVGSWDFYQPMYQDGDPTKPVLANLYLRSKGGKVYVLVQAAAGNSVNADGRQAWVHNNVFAAALVPWDQGPNPTWVDDGLGNIVGYEASFTPPTTAVAQPPYEFHVSVSSGGTSYAASTRSKVAGNIKLILPNCQVGIGDRVYFEENGLEGYQPDEDVPAPKDIDIEVVNADTNAVTTAKTDREGCFLVEGLNEGRYFIRLRKQLFELNGKLYQFTPAVPYTGADVGAVKDDDADHNGFGDAGAVVTNAYLLESGTMPVTNLRPAGVEVSGDRACQYTAGTLPDPSVNRTADIGLVGEKVAIGNLAWRENPLIPGQTEGKFESAYDVRAKGMTVYLDLIDPYMQQDGCKDDSPDIKGTLLETTDDVTGFFLFDQLIPGSFRLRIEPGEFGDSGQLKGYLASNGFAADPSLVNDDNDDHNAIRAGDPSTDGVCTATFEVWPGYAPTTEAGAYAGVQGRQHSDLPDENVDLSRDLAFSREGGDPPNIMSIGSAVWIDANHDGRQTPGWTDLNKNTVQDPGEIDEPGIADVQLVLTGGNLAVPKETTSAADGTYLFRNLAPASDYVVTIPATEMVSGGHVADALKEYYAKRGISTVNVPARAVSTLFTAVSWDDKRDGDNNGSQTGLINATLPPSAATATGIELRPYLEPIDGTGVNDEFASGATQDQELASDPDFQDETSESMDQSGDMTIDFGFVHVCQEICDINGDGKVTAADTAVIYTRGLKNLKVDKTNLAGTGNCQQSGIMSRNDFVYCGKLVAPNAK